MTIPCTHSSQTITHKPHLKTTLAHSNLAIYLLSETCVHLPKPTKMQHFQQPLDGSHSHTQQNTSAVVKGNQRGGKPAQEVEDNEQQNNSNRITTQ